MSQKISKGGGFCQGARRYPSVDEFVREPEDILGRRNLSGTQKISKGGGICQGARRYPRAEEFVREPEDILG